MQPKKEAKTPPFVSYTSRFTKVMLGLCLLFMLGTAVYIGIEIYRGAYRSALKLLPVWALFLANAVISWLALRNGKRIKK